MTKKKPRGQYFKVDQGGHIVWSKVATQAAAMLAVGGTHTPSSVCRDLEISRSWLTRMRKHPEFLERIQVIRDGWHAETMEWGIAQKMERVRHANERWNLLQQIILDRQAAYTPEAIYETGRHRIEPGQATGLLTRKLVPSKSGAIEEWQVDQVLLDSFLKLEKQISIEMGQWEEHKSKSPSPFGIPNPDDEVFSANGRPKILEGNPARMSDAELAIEMDKLQRALEAGTDDEASGSEGSTLEAP